MSYAKARLGEKKYKAVRRLLKHARKLIEQYNEENHVWEDNLSGGCGFGAGLVLWCMKRAGYDSVYVVHNHDHCWVEWDSDGETFLLDITGTQFGLPKTLLREKRRCPWMMYHWSWGMRKDFKPQTSWTRFANNLRKRGWRETHLFLPEKVIGL